MPPVLTPISVLSKLSWDSNEKTYILKCKYTFQSFLFKPDVANIGTCWTSPKMSFVWLICLLKMGISSQHWKARDFFMKVGFQVFFRNLKIRPQRAHVASSSSLRELRVSRPSLQGWGPLQLTPSHLFSCLWSCLCCCFSDSRGKGKVKYLWSPCFSQKWEKER